MWCENKQALFMLIVTDDVNVGLVVMEVPTKTDTKLYQLLAKNKEGKVAFCFIS